METGRSRTPAVLLASGVLLVLCLLLFLLAPDGAPDPVTHSPATSPVAVPAAPAPPPTAAAPAPAAPPAAPPAAAPATTGSIAGSALRLDGAPAPGARILATPGGDESKRKVATAGEDGAFRFEGLEPGLWSLACAGGGYGTRLDQGAREVEVEVIAGAEVRAEVRGQALAQVAGRVTGPDGKPVPRAAVRLQCEAFLSPTPAAWHLEEKTGEDGAYEFRSATPGKYAALRVTADGFGAAGKDLRELASGSRTVVDFSLEPALSIDLLLVAADDGTPVREATVWVIDAASGDLYEGPHGDAFRPDEQGRVRASGLRDAAIGVQIQAKGFAWTREHLDAPSALPGPVTFRLVRTLSISGRLLRADGTPAAGEIVRAIPVGETNPLAPFEFNLDAITADDGAFTIEGLRAGRWTVGVWSGPGQPLVTTDADAEATGVPLRLPVEAVSGRVRIRFQAPDGSPVPLVIIRTGFMVNGHVSSSAGGRMHQRDKRIVLEEGKTAFVEAWDARDAAEKPLPLGHVFAVVPSDALAEWVVTLPAERAVEGRVTGPDGRPVEGAAIEVATVPPEGISQNLASILRGTVSGPGGRFRVDGLGTGRVRLRASAEGLFGDPVTAAGGEADVVLALSPEARCELRVLDAEGKPVEGSIVSVRPERDPEESGFGGLFRDSIHATTDDGGRVRLRGLDPARKYQLLVNIPNTHPHLLQHRQSGWTPASGDVRLETGVVLEGVVRVGGAAPPEGWRGRIDVRRDGFSYATVTIDASGAFRIEPINSGRWELSVWVGEFPGKRSATVEAIAGGPPVTIEVPGE